MATGLWAEKMILMAGQQDCLYMHQLQLNGTPTSILTKPHSSGHFLHLKFIACSATERHLSLMWQLELLSWVVPAFGALAKEFTDSGPDAQDCYSDLVNIGLAVSTSRGEWNSGLEDEHVSRLLKALESRIPNRRMPFIFSMPSKVGFKHAT